MSLDTAPWVASPEYIVKQTHKRKLQTIELWLSDASDKLHVLTVPIDMLEEALDEGLALEGPLALAFRTSPEQELRLRPDPQTFRFLPEKTPKQPRARLLCEVELADGTSSPLCPRALLASTVSSLANVGVRFEVQATLSHRWSKASHEGQALPSRAQLHNDTAALLTQLSIPWRGLYDHAFEPTLNHTFVEFERLDARTLADSWVTYRQLMRELSLEHQSQVTWEHFSAEGYSELSLSRDSRSEGAWGRFGEDTLYPAGVRTLEALTRELPALSLLMRSSPQNYIQTQPLKVSPRHRRLEDPPLSLVLSNADPCTPPYTSLSLLLQLAHHASLGDYQAAPPQAMPTTLAEAAEAAAHSPMMRQTLGTPMLEHLLAQAKQRSTRGGYRRSG